MRHALSLEGLAFRLRPVAEADAGFVVALRADPALNRFLHASASGEAAQMAWFEAYFARAGDYYFVIENRATGEAEGLIAIYDIDPVSRMGEWGRWILRAGSMAAVESAWLIYRVAFELLELQRVYCRTVARNERVVSFHDSCSLSERRVLPAHFLIGGEKMDAVEHALSRAEWAEGRLSARLSALAAAAARFS